MQLQKQAKLLPEPVIHSYNQEGVGDVDVADPSKPLEVLVGPIDLSQRDRIDLYWGANDAVIDTYVHSPDAPETNGIVSLYVNTRWIESGLTDVRYTYTRFPAGNPEPSPVKQVVVKLEIPGDRDPDPATPYENEKLDLPVISPPGIITSPEGVSVTLKPWENMVVGDVPSVYWHGLRIQLPPLTLPQIGRPLVVPIDKEVIIEAGDSENIVVRYEIRDVVNNWSRFSLPAYVEVEAGDFTLPAPIAPQAPNMMLNLDKLAGADIQALVISHPEIAIGDTIDFVSERSTAEGIELPPYSVSKVVTTPSSFVEFLIPNAQFVPIAQGRARFKYSVTKVSGQRLRSKSLPLSVIGQPQRLEPPSIPAAVDGVLDPALHAVVARVPPYHFMMAGDDVTLVWMGRTSMGSTVMHQETKRLSGADIGKLVEYVIPDEKLRVLAGGSVEIYYTVLTPTAAFFKSPVLGLRVGEDYSSPLPRPRVKEASGDTLDPINTPNGATVVIDASARLRAGDRVFTIWQGPKGYGHKDQIVTESQTGKSLEVLFAPSLVNDNAGEVVQVVYAVYRLNGPMQRSETISIKVVERFGDLPAPRVKEANGDTLNPIDTPNGATVVIGATANLRAGDRVYTIWNGPKENGHRDQIVTESQAGKAFEVVFAPSLVTDNVGGVVKVVYAVYRLDGPMQRSETISIKVVERFGDLPAPRIKEANGDTLDPINAPSGATVVIDASANLRAGDRVFTIWQGPKGYGDKDQIVTEAQAGKTLEVVFAPSLVTDNAGQTVQVAYAVYRLDGPMQRSETLHVKVVDKPLDLPAPRMDTVGADGVLDPALIPDSGATVRVKYPGMGTQDRVVVTWRGASLHDTPAQVPGGGELLFTLPKALIIATAGAAASVTYTVTRAGTEKVSAPLGLRVKQGMTFDTSPVILPGKVYLLPGSPDVLPRFPAGTTVQRTATGGQAPYTYTSSNNLVAKVDSQGLTSVRGNGEALISVTDALGETLSFRVTVTGVVHCIGVGNGSYAQMTAAAAGVGGRLPSIDELKQLYAAYAGRWPMGNGNYWSSTVAAQNLVGMKWYFVKNLVTGMDFKLMHHNASLCVALR
jgi:hypothetical protein